MQSSQTFNDDFPDLLMDMYYISIEKLICLGSQKSARGFSKKKLELELYRLLDLFLFQGKKYDQ